MRRNEANAPESFLSIWILLVVLVIVGVGFRLSLHKIEEGFVVAVGFFFSFRLSFHFACPQSYPGL
jgi:hypothetical protein